MVSASTLDTLAAPPSPPPSPSGTERPARDRVVDVALVLLALGVGLVGIASEAQRPGGLSGGPLRVDLVVGSVACLALLVRRRRPVELAATLRVVAAFTAMAGGAAIIALFTVAEFRRWRDVGPVWALYVLGVATFYLLRPEPGLALPCLALPWPRSWPFA